MGLRDQYAGLSERRRDWVIWACVLAVAVVLTIGLFAILSALAV